MEVYFAATGVKHELDYFENQLQFQPFLLPFTDKDGKEYQQPLYGILSPIKLYRFIFPEKYLDEVIKMLDFNNKSNYAGFDKQAFFLRKLLNAKKLPIPKPETRARLFHKGNVGLIGIGYKPDTIITEPDGKTHEAI
jgi:hypothetical protein